MAGERAGHTRSPSLSTVIQIQTTQTVCEHQVAQLLPYASHGNDGCIIYGTNKGTEPYYKNKERLRVDEMQMQTPAVMRHGRRCCTIRIILGQTIEQSLPRTMSVYHNLPRSVPRPAKKLLQVYSVGITLPSGPRTSLKARAR